MAVPRDIKPDNYLLVSSTNKDSFTLKLVDFGLACRMLPGRAHENWTKTAEDMSYLSRMQVPLCCIRQGIRVQQSFSQFCQHGR
eukprot:28277-Amphidinium_carterae.1